MATILGNMISTVRDSVAFRAARARHNRRALASIAGRGGYNGGYDTGGKRSNLVGGTEAEDCVVDYDYPYMISATMDLYRNSPFARSIVDTVGTYMGQSRPQATTSDSEWNKRATAYFNEYWWNIADARARAGVDYGTIQDQWNLMAFLQGDVLYEAVKGRLYPFEGSQIATPSKLRNDKNIVRGLRVGASFPHRVTHYYVCQSSKFGGLDRNVYRRLSNFDAFYAPTRAWRPSMLRSVPDLHGIIDALRDFERTADGIRTKVGFDTMLITKERKGAVNALGKGWVTGDSANGQKTKVTQANGQMRVEVAGKPEDFQTTEMKNPGGTFVPYMEFDGRLITAGVGFPLEIAMHLYNQGSYTANRATRCDFKRYIKNRWEWRKKVVTQPHYNWVIANAIKRGSLPPAPVNEMTGVSEWYKAVWTLPHFDQIDENKEAMGDQKRWELGQDSLQDWAQARGMTDDDMLRMRTEGYKKAKAQADELGIPLSEYMPKLFPAQPKEEAAVVLESDDKKDPDKSTGNKWLR